MAAISDGDNDSDSDSDSDSSGEGEGDGSPGDGGHDDLAVPTATAMPAWRMASW